MVIEAVVRPFCVGRDVERVRRGAQAHHGATRFEVVVDQLHLGVGQVSEARGYDHEVGIGEGLEPGDILEVVRVDDTGHGGVLRKEHDGFETVALGEDFGELGQGFFRAVFFVAADEYDALAVTGTSLARVGLPLGRLGRRGAGD